MKRISAIEGEERYTGRGSAPPLPFSFVLIEWTSGPVTVLPFVGNSAVPRTAVRVAITLRRPEIVSLLPEDLQNHSYRIRMGVDLAPAVGARSPAAVPTGTYIHTYSQYYSMAGSIAT